MPSLRAPPDTSTLSLRPLNCSVKSACDAAELTVVSLCSRVSLLSMQTEATPKNTSPDAERRLTFVLGQILVAFHGLPTHRFNNCESHALSPSRSLTQRVFITPVGVNSRNSSVRSSLPTKNSSHPPHVQLGSILRMVSPQAHFSKWHNFSSVVLALDRTIRHSPGPLHLEIVYNPCTVSYDPVQLLSCISLRRLLEMRKAVPELSNSLVLHAPSSLSILLALQSQSELWIDTA